MLYNRATPTAAVAKARRLGTAVEAALSRDLVMLSHWVCLYNIASSERTVSMREPTRSNRIFYSTKGNRSAYVNGALFFNVAGVVKQTTA